MSVELRESEPADRALAAPRVTEEVLRFSDDDHVIAILTLPAAPPSPTTPAVLLLNAGVLHRIGPHRLHVDLARRLAARGLPVLRLDLSGIGDSGSAVAGLTFRESSVADTRAAMDLLAQRVGARRFVLFGVCSGADNGMATAAADDRVAGLALVDSYSYATTASRLREELTRARRDVALWAGRRLGSVGAQLRDVGRRVAGAARLGPPGGAEPGERPPEGRVAPPLDVYRATMLDLVARRVTILAVFSGSLHERYNDEDQIFEWVPEARGRIERAYYPSANHTFTELGSRERLLGAVEAWFGRFIPTTTTGDRAPGL